MKKFLIFSLLLTSGIIAQNEIILSKESRKITPENFTEIASHYDVVLLGEEHDDKAGHEDKLKIIESFTRYSSKKIIIGLEMLDSDRQSTMDEYLSGFINHSSFFQSIKPNNISAYFPIIEFARNNGIPVVGTNIPRKYANIVSRNGLESIESLPNSARQFLPPLYQVNLYRQKDYEKKIALAFGEHGHGSSIANMTNAMYLWDTAMAHSIANSNPFKKYLFIHINGRYHSDEGFGITHRLRMQGFSVLTVSMIPEKQKDNADLRFADIIWYTKNLQHLE